MENFIFCAVLGKVLNTPLSLISRSTIEKHYWPQARFKPTEDLSLDWPERKYTLKNFIARRERKYTLKNFIARRERKYTLKNFIARGQKALNRNFRI